MTPGVKDQGSQWTHIREVGHFHDSNLLQFSVNVDLELTLAPRPLGDTVHYSNAVLDSEERHKKRSTKSSPTHVPYPVVGLQDEFLKGRSDEFFLGDSSYYQHAGLWAGINEEGFKSCPPICVETAAMTITITLAALLWRV